MPAVTAAACSGHVLEGEYTRGTEVDVRVEVCGAARVADGAVAFQSEAAIHINERASVCAEGARSVRGIHRLVKPQRHTAADSGLPSVGVLILEIDEAGVPVGRTKDGHGADLHIRRVPADIVNVSSASEGDGECVAGVVAETIDPVGAGAADDGIRVVGEAGYDEAIAIAGVGAVTDRAEVVATVTEGTHVEVCPVHRAFEGDVGDLVRGGGAWCDEAGELRLVKAADKAQQRGGIRRAGHHELLSLSRVEVRGGPDARARAWIHVDVIDTEGGRVVADLAIAPVEQTGVHIERGIQIVVHAVDPERASVDLVDEDAASIGEHAVCRAAGACTAADDEFRGVVDDRAALEGGGARDGEAVAVSVAERERL